MYEFNIVKNDDSSWRFELGGINLIIDDFSVKDQKHFIKNPKKAIAFFNINGNLYGLANQLNGFNTAEDFYEMMREQYSYFQ